MTYLNISLPREDRIVAVNNRQHHDDEVAPSVTLLHILYYACLVNCHRRRFRFRFCRYSPLDSSFATTTTTPQCSGKAGLMTGGQTLLPDGLHAGICTRYSSNAGRRPAGRWPLLAWDSARAQVPTRSTFYTQDQTPGTGVPTSYANTNKQSKQRTTMVVVVPINEHPLDWFTVPELKGEPVDIMVPSARTSGCFYCRLCDTGQELRPGRQLLEHYQTPLHIRNSSLLEARRRELHELVRCKEEELLEQKKRREDAIERKRAQERKSQEKKQKAIEQARLENMSLRLEKLELENAQLLRQKMKEQVVVEKEENVVEARRLEQMEEARQRAAQRKENRQQRIAAERIRDEQTRRMERLVEQKEEARRRALHERVAARPSNMRDLMEQRQQEARQQQRQHKKQPPQATTYPARGRPMTAMHRPVAVEYYGNGCEVVMLK